MPESLLGAKPDNTENTPAPAANNTAADTNTNNTLLGGSTPGSSTEDAANKGGEKSGQQGEKVAEKGNEKAAPAGAPESYADFKLPEGLTADEAMLGEFKTIAKEVGLTQEQAQKIVDLQTKALQESSVAAENHWKTTVEQWRQDAMKELGVNHAQEMGIAKSAISKFGDEKFIQLLNDTGLGNHPAMINFARKVGKAIAEDNLGEGKQAGGQVPDSKLFYPNMK